jgi:restriction system protein
MWEKKQAAEAVRETRQRAAQEKDAKKTLAAERTAEAQDILSGIDQTLLHTLNLNDRIEWDSLLDRKPFPKALPLEPKWHLFPQEPKDSDPQFAPTRKWYYAIFGNLRQRAEQESKNRFVLAHETWCKQISQVDAKNKALIDEWNLNEKRWQQEREQYEQEQAQRNGQILDKKKAYFERYPQAIIEYFDMVLSNSQYLDTFPQESDLEYLEDAKTIVVDYFLPSPDEVPTLKEVKYIASKDEFQEVQLQEAAFNKMYDRLLYQIALRSIHEIYESDQVDAVAAVVFNGWVRSIDRGTGKPITVCVLSVQAPRDEFQKVDLRHVDPKICFKTLKGVGSSKLHGLSPIAPILQLNKEDKRFISSYSVVGEIDQSINLAAMDWEDFEHLIREVFEKEFSQNGGEVKITQASRDGGVDAVAFDPDPIRGGKIVIQAKRYTNTVGVSAVRDLYGTVVNEGATKGILVTTADYGPDAYGFAKGKPLTLLSGSNLLHLLEKHGHKATIDLKAAKQILADQKKAEEG